MAARDRESKLDKLKQFFKISKTTSVNLKIKSDIVLTPEIEKEIGPETPIQQRIKALKELSEIVVANRLEDYSVERLWKLVIDLFNKDVEKEYRHVAFYFLKCLVQGQYEKLSLMRVHFFNFIRKHNLTEDIIPLFELVQVLTNEGRDIHHLEEEFGSFVGSWLPAIAGAGRVADFLDLIVNFIKYNAAYVDDRDTIEIVQSSCFICCWSQDSVAVENCLKVLATIVCYSELPSEALRDFVAALCRKVNTSELTLTCWKVMRDLLGTHMGHSTLFTLCKFLQDTGSYSDRLLLRGAVFFINMGLWSDKRVPSLKCTPTSVLPSLLQSLDCGHSLVVYEVMHSVQRLVVAYGVELQRPAWDIVLEILRAVVLHVDDTDRQKNNEPKDDRIATKLHDTLTSMEQLIELGQFNGSVSGVFQIIEMSSKARPEGSVLRLINYFALSVRPTSLDWLTKLNSMVERYYKQETRPNIRIKVVDVISNVVCKYRYIYEEELVERIILAYLTHVDQESELCVRNSVAQLLLSFCQESESKKCMDVLCILEKLINRPYDQNINGLSTEGDIIDVKTVASGLIQAFQSKIMQTPACHAVKIYKILIGHLENHYLHPTVLGYKHSVHILIFELLLKLRVNRLGLIGVTSSMALRFSPYLTVESGSGPAYAGSAPPSPAPTPFSLASASKVIISALKIEKDWRIVNLLLQELPTVLQNKALIADKYGADVGLLADALCSMIMDKSLKLPESLRYMPTKVTRTDFQSCVFPVIAAISAYHTYLEPSQQIRCIKCLEYGLASRCASQCVIAITTCTLEMRDTMYKLLPEVLLNLSKISATVVIAIPILEFLSTLTSLPKVFGSFVGDQYMSVFAIALPYTNPFKYNHYTVSLAHHVIAVWFLKCRLPFRRDFVKFIYTGLKANAIDSFEEGQMMKSELAAFNEDSTSRKRSSSLTEQGSRRRERPLPNARLSADLRPPLDDALMDFHVELTETCIDLMARYTFSSCEARSTRSPTADFLLSGGQQQTWLLGHKLITVSTSGCLQKSLKNNLCERCWMSCRLNKDLLSPDAENEDKPRKSFDKQPEELSGSDVAGDESKSGTNVEMEKLIYGSNDDIKTNRDVCACWCQGWAEIHVRRPTGEMSWIMRLENLTPCSGTALDQQPMTDLAALFLPVQPPQSQAKRSVVASSTDESMEDQPSDGVTISTSQSTQPASHPVSIPGSPGSRQSSRESLAFVESDGNENDEGNPSDLDSSIMYPKKSQPTPMIGGKSRNPVRRSNSSPEMSGNWKNPFLKDKGQAHGIHDDSPKARVSCEAIPEEMTPPDPQPHIPINTIRNMHPKDLHLDVSLSVDVSVKSVRGPATVGEIESTSDDHGVNSGTFTRDRSRTISVMSPVRKSRYELEHSKPKLNSPRNKEAPRSGVSPSFVFLQLYHSSHFGPSDEKPILVSNNMVIQRAIMALDFIPPFQTHKVGVVYVGPGQANSEAEMLRNEFGSVRYALFLQSLGTLINLKNADPQSTFLGGLDKSGPDGKFAYIWQDDVTQVTFHVATLMPNKEQNSNCNEKKLHIGNDYVTIIYNESGEEYAFLKFGQMNYASVVIEPMDMGSNKVTVKAKDEVSELIGQTEHKIVSDENLAILARQLALHANLASEVCISLKTKNRDPYASNWLERLRKIKRLRKKVLEMDEQSDTMPQRTTKRPVPIDDFTEYT